MTDTKSAEEAEFYAWWETVPVGEFSGVNADHVKMAWDYQQQCITTLKARIAELEKVANMTDSYVQSVPDKCDRIVWRHRYYHLPLPPAPQDSNHQSHSQEG